MSLILQKAVCRIDGGQIIYTCPFCLSLRSASVSLAVMHHSCLSGTVYFFNGHVLKNAGQYNAETRAEIERKRNG